jgi:hypothetical protein
MQVQSKFIANLAVVTAKIGDLAVTTGKVAANAITGAKILLANLEWLRGRNAANDGDINIARVTAANEIETAVVWNFNTALPQSTLTPTLDEELTTKAYVDNAIPASLASGYEPLALDATDITNQYVDLAEEISPNSLQVLTGGVVQRQDVDYSLSLEGGVTRITFLGDLATAGAAALVDGDVLYCQYLY